MRRTFFIPVLVIALFSIGVAGGCGGEGGDAAPDYSGEDDAVVIRCEITGDSEFNVAELMTLPDVSRQVIRETDDGRDEYEVRGVLLDELLDNLAVARDELDGIRVVAGDGYSVNVPHAIVMEHEIILAYEIEGEALNEDSRPLRVFIPGEEPMYWVRNVVEIELLRPEEQASEVREIIFLESATDMVDAVQYDDGQEAVKTADLLAGVTGSESVFMMAVDGFTKTEQHDVFSGAYLVTTGEDAPAFRSPDLPRGMHVRDLAWFITGHSAFYAVARGPELHGTVYVEDRVGVSLALLADELGLKVADRYILEATDGYEVDISRDDLQLGIVYMRDDGQVASAFDGLPRNTAVRGLLSLRIAQ